jgi:hypothetical protein
MEVSKDKVYSQITLLIIAFSNLLGIQRFSQQFTLTRVFGSTYFGTMGPTFPVASMEELKQIFLPKKRWDPFVDNYSHLQFNAVVYSVADQLPDPACHFDVD